MIPTVPASIAISPALLATLCILVKIRVPVLSIAMRQRATNVAVPKASMALTVKKTRDPANRVLAGTTVGVAHVKRLCR